MTPAGLIYLNNRIVYISALLHREDVGLEQIDDHQRELYLSFYRLGRKNCPQTAGLLLNPRVTHV